MPKLVFFLFIIINYNSISISMENKPYHHLPDGTFRNPEGSPVRSEKIKFSYSQFIKEKKKIDMTISKDHVIEKSKVLAETFKEIPEDRILVETDAPYLAPIPLRGKPNEPSYIIHTVDFLSKLRNVSFNLFAKQTTINFYNLFGKLK